MDLVGVNTLLEEYEMTKKSDLPLLPSERKELTDQIKQEKNRADTIYAALMRKINGIIVRSIDLTTKQKETLITELLK